MAAQLGLGFSSRHIPHSRSLENAADSEHPSNEAGRRAAPGHQHSLPKASHHQMEQRIGPIARGL